MKLIGGIRPLSVLVAVVAVVPLAVTGIALATSASAATPTCTSILVVKHYGYHSYEYERLPSTSSGATSCLLAQGNAGDGVYTLQRNLHYCYDSSLVVDSTFGSATRAALTKAQKAAGMATADQDGVYGPKSRDAIDVAVFRSGGDAFLGCKGAWG